MIIINYLQKLFVLYNQISDKPLFKMVILRNIIKCTIFVTISQSKNCPYCRYLHASKYKIYDTSI